MNIKHLKSTAIILSALVLSSCATSDTSAPTTTTNTTSQENSQTLISYYQSAIADLENSIINMKEDFYITEQEYKLTIKELEAKINSLNEQKPNEDQETENISYIPFSYATIDGITSITSYTGTASKITIPSQIGTTQIHKIGEGALSYEIKSIIISEGIEEIDWFAFSKCSQLREIYIPMSVKKIGYGAFDGCPSDLVIKCPASSYAEAYAKSFALNYIIV